MLHLLAEQAKSRGLDPEPGFVSKDVRWSLSFDGHGQFMSVIELGDVSSPKNRGRTFMKCPNMPFSELRSGGEAKCHFLAETAQVVTLFGSVTGNDKTSAKHQFYTDLLRQASVVTPVLGQIAETLNDTRSLSSIQEQLTQQKVRATDKVTLDLEGRILLDDQSLMDWWRQFLRGMSTIESSERMMRCLATGKLVKPAATHPKITGLTDVGGLSTGDVLIGFKQESFCSYGLDQSANASVSEHAAAAYAAGLNDLIRNDSSRLAGSRVVHWFKEKLRPEDDPLAFLATGEEEEAAFTAARKARQLLESIRTGERTDLGANWYYAMTLSSVGGRVMVRDWMEGQFERLAENVAVWFEDLDIVHRSGDGRARSPKFMAVLGSTVRALDDLAAPFVASMWRAAVSGLPIPRAALSQAVARVRADIVSPDVVPNHARMGLLKAFHVRKARHEGKDSHMKPELNEVHPHPAYHCGRLLAVLAEVQRAALGDVGAGVVQRYYGSASTTPALIFGRIIRTSQFHIGKIASDRPGLARWFEQRIAGITSAIGSVFPTTLSLEEQSLFALGYYQQMAARKTDANQTMTEAANG